MKTPCLASLLFLGLLSLAQAQDEAEPVEPDPESEAPAPAPPVLTPEEQTIADQANAYVAAYNSGDVQALGAMFSEDAEWVDADGNLYSGRTGITAMLDEALGQRDGRTLALSVESARPVTAEVIVEKGISTITDKDGRNSVGSYTAVHVKKDDAWKITQFTETGAPLAGDAALRLRELEWLVGTWVDQSESVEATATVEWTENHTFLTRAFSFQVDGAEPTRGTEVIGWDPTRGRIRSWVFQSDGGFSENIWTQDGDRWLIQHRAVLPDGGQGSAQQTLTFVDTDTFTFSSASRNLDGELLPDIDPITAVRVR